MNRPAGTYLTIDQVSLALEPFGVGISDGQLEAIRKYASMLHLWNQRINLTAVDEPLEIVARHFGESIFAGTLLPFHSGRLADVGTGAGFPGLALKIAFPGLSVTLLEPNLKKCAFLNEVKSALNLRGVEIQRVRYEECRFASRLDFICSRALGGHRRFLQWAHDALLPTGRVILWLGMEDSNLVARTNGWKWDLPARIPESRRRVVISGLVA